MDAVVIILAIVGAIVGAVTVGGAVYYAASNAGVIGDELATYTIIGAVAGAIVGGLSDTFYRRYCRRLRKESVLHCQN